jgi:hypothetical protein
MHDLYSHPNPPYIYLAIAATCFSFALVWSRSGKKKWTYRAKDLTRYWWGIATLYLGGALSVWIFLYKVHAL